MRIVLYVIGILLIAIGCIWFLQGIDVLPGSFMTGQIKWAVYGAIAVAVGAAAVVLATRLRRKTRAN